MGCYLRRRCFRGQSEIKVAQVCWITDTEDCGGADFVGTDLEGGTPEVIPPGGGDAKSCIRMGYDKTSCPSGYKGNKYCPLDNKYFAECIPDCPSSYVTCEAPLKGVGTVCGNGLKIAVIRHVRQNINTHLVLFPTVMRWTVNLVNLVMVICTKSKRKIVLAL